MAKRERLAAAGCYALVLIGFPAVFLGAAWLRGWTP